MLYEFQSKEPHNTIFLMVRYTEDEQKRFDRLVKVFATKGWEENPRPRTFRPGEKREFWTDGGLRDGMKRAEVCFSAKGSDLFGSWTNGERAVHMMRIKSALRKLGVDPRAIPYRKLRLEDML